MFRPLPKDETARVAALRSYRILDSTPESDFDELAQLAAQVCRTPTALLSLVDHERQWHKARVGFHLSQIELQHSFCSHAIEQRDILTITDARNDPRFKNNPLVAGEPQVRFYAGSPLINREGYALGTLCVLDRKPRRLNEGQKGALAMLSRRAMMQLELRRQLGSPAQIITPIDETLGGDLSLERESRYRLAFEHGGLGVLIIDHERNRIEANPALARIVERAADEISQMSSAEFLKLFKCDDSQDDLRAVINGRRDYFSGEKCYVQRSTAILQERWCKLTATHVHAEDGNNGSNSSRYTVITVDDITTHKESERQLLHDAFHDSLTQLPNRHLFLDRLAQSIDRLRRRPHQLFAVMFLDVDKFKPVNDTYGHEVGDRLLIKIAERLKLCLRTTDTIARFGGDEFTILLEPVAEHGDAESIAARIRADMREPILLDGHEFYMTLSIGTVLATHEHTRPEELLRDADRAMYRAKITDNVVLH